LKLTVCEYRKVYLQPHHSEAPSPTFIRPCKLLCRQLPSNSNIHVPQPIEPETLLLSDCLTPECFYFITHAFTASKRGQQGHADRHSLTSHLAHHLGPVDNEEVQLRPSGSAISTNGDVPFFFAYLTFLVTVNANETRSCLRGLYWATKPAILVTRPRVSAWRPSLIQTIAVISQTTPLVNSTVVQTHLPQCTIVTETHSLVV